MRMDTSTMEEESNLLTFRRSLIYYKSYHKPDLRLTDTSTYYSIVRYQPPAGTTTTTKRLYSLGTKNNDAR